MSGFSGGSSAVMVGDSGSGGVKGLVPAPAAGDAAAGKFLKADGSFAVPPGTGASSGTAIQKGNGSGGFSAATAGTDYLAPPSGTAILKANSGGALANASAGTDYLAPPSGTAILKANSGGALANATAGTDYLAPPSGTSILKANSGGALSNASAGVDYGRASIDQNSQSAAYTTVLGDAGKHIYHPSTDANARTFTIDSNANVAYPVGTTLTFVNETSQVVTIAITSDTLVLGGAGTTGSRSLAQYGVATALKVGTTRWYIFGPGLT